MSGLDRPIVVLGAPRSGTTLLAETLLARHPDVAYWPEPVFVWRYGNAYRSHDVLGPEHATPRVKRYIRRRFAEYVEERGASRFLEKTPSNSLRVSFVREVLPEIRVVHVIRDGRDAARSTADEWGGPGQQALERRELREGGRLRQAWTGLATWLRLGERVDDLRSLLELPSYTGRFFGFLARHLLRTDRVPWGPRFPGLWRLRSTLSLLETCALQWMVCVETARSAGARMPDARYQEVRYEDLIARPRREMAALLAFLDMEATDDLLDGMADTVVERPVPAWPDRLAPDEVTAIEARVGATLQCLGYELSGPEPGRQAATTERGDDVAL